MYCSSCATPIEAGQTVCRTCGNVLAATPVSPIPTPPFAPEPVVRGNRPGTVVIATGLLAISVGMSVIGIANAWVRVGPARMASFFTAWLALFVLAVWAATVMLTWNGKSAARILVIAGLAWTAINMLMSPAAVISAGRGSIMGQLYWLNLAMRLIAAYLLFQKESSAWFKARPLS